MRGRQIEIKIQDYRDVSGTFVRIVAVDVLEHVGYKNYRNFMRIKKFFMQSHMLLAENEGLLPLAARAGCLGVFVGIESVSADTLSEANKGFNRVDRLKDNIARFHDRGIMVDGGIIFGFDTDTPDVFDRSIDVLEKIKIDSVAVNILIPYPGTEFYKKFEREGRIICTDYKSSSVYHNQLS
jgi:radical SAM superfamily enzyme YgiQ (UPF0313 family)